MWCGMKVVLRALIQQKKCSFNLSFQSNSNVLMSFFALTYFFNLVKYGLEKIHKKIQALFAHIWEDLPWWLSHKKWEFSPSLCPHLGLFNHIWSLLVISSEPIGRSESWYAKIWSKKMFAFTQQSNSNFWVEIFENVIPHELKELFT